MIQKTFILDTNVYGELLIEEKGLGIIKKIENDKSLFIYGVDIIEKELHDVPSDKKIKGKIFKDIVLMTYRSLIDAELHISPLMDYLAGQYYKKYAELRGSGKYYKLISAKDLKYGEDSLKVDFQIIAIASIKGVDVVVSADIRTMLSKLSAETYSLVNKINGLRTPKLVDYFEFRGRYAK